jgi:hypothetical protein
MRSVLLALAFMTLTAGEAIAIPPILIPARNLPLRLAQVNRAEQVCVDAVRNEGYRVTGILSTSTFAGGAEIIMEVGDRRETFVVGCDYADNTRNVELYRLEVSGNRRGGGYDDHGNYRYSDRYNNRRGGRYDDYYEEYDDAYDDREDYRYGDRSDDRYNDRYQRNDRHSDYQDDWQRRFQTSSGIRDESDAESIARAVVGDQLGIDDPYSEVVRIDLVRRESGRSNRHWIVEGRVNGAPFVVRIRSSDAYVLGFDLY